MIESNDQAIEYPEPEPCGGCGAAVGERHVSCDWECCPLCGGQIIACPCIYTMNGIDYDNMEEAHPAIYNGGPTDEMYEKRERELEGRWVKHDGHYPGTKLAVEQGWYSYWGPGPGPWIECDKDHPEATPDLNRAAAHGKWDAEKQRLVLRRGS